VGGDYEPLRSSRQGAAAAPDGMRGVLPGVGDEDPAPQREAGWEGVKSSGFS
jgi:hypothetical protein